ncbi:MFS transporter [Bradyrhizobium sp. U87765 SZCCT0131]|uniref:MFS transporter n=1 Tax=unclassified Bradyrhizobium TaxID=2631580 RepID=UPI001BA9DAE2|nr:MULTISPECIES: MFS transporter [unclassified Bradyrhizobium]MBR1219401.1 MFS transporter [Bradyrhizobium sp. U87765 SZCCT0131]MBR1262052.1 MFS transporter [Bradyrhizobium sp. U87765 SZCCT0134]MBR1306095.1 MFS transporter [Bradyrhizobium sp. U87765 SZCCT0110]MBR1317834.1 MFS transporter [Bradyrhizobium sp. U87765 SZCCT0109]MBR1351536.1 MFS transporter [Bradyrhizobium sp. U87765 SZCCT0048]
MPSDPSPAPSEAATIHSGALLRHPPFLSFFATRTLSRFAGQITSVAVGWQLYEITGSAFYLGLAGLTQFLPTALLVFVAGQAADRYERRRVMQICQSAEGLTAVVLAVASFGGWLSVPMIFCALAVFGTASAFESPVAAALLPATAPPGRIQEATAVWTAGSQFATITGPALGGLSYAVSPAAPYALMAGFWLAAALLTGSIRVTGPIVDRSQQPTPGALFEGVRFVRSNPTILGTISLDLFAVLLGGAAALLPIYARDILHTGPWGLGVLRAAPAVGALAMTLVLARTPLTRRVGMRMFQAVIAFGAATVVFALSQWLWLSLAALVAMGAADTVSVVIRFSLVQLATPDAMRGRVGAVNFLFINASNQLGDFESGMVAGLLGAVPAAVIGGLGTIAIALIWMKLFPSLRHVEKLQ